MTPERFVIGATAARRASAAPPSDGFEEALREKTAEIKEILASEAEIEERIRKKYEREYAKRLESEIKKRQEANKRAGKALSKYNARFRELTMWGIRATRARSALRHFWVRQEDGKLSLPVLVTAGGKRLAIQNQVIVEFGSLQPSRSGCSGTEYTIKERLLAWRQDVHMGLASWHERSDKDTADRVRRQTSTSAVLYPRGHAGHAPRSARGAPIQLLQLMSLSDPRIKP